MNALCTALALGIALVPGRVAFAQHTARVSVDSAGSEGNNLSYQPSISGDGRFVAFESAATNLVGGDTNGFQDVFVHDGQTGTTERVSVDSAGLEGNSGSSNASISADGRFVAFMSWASNLVPGDTNFKSDIFVHDRQTGTTDRISVDSSGTQGNGNCGNPSISADGGFVAFWSYSTKLVSGDTNGYGDIFVRDRQSGTTERVSVDSAGKQANQSSLYSSISADGQLVAFDSAASNLVSGDTNRAIDVFVHDRQSGTTERVSVDSSGSQGDGDSRLPSISSNGQVVAFESDADDLVPGDSNALIDIFVHDRPSGATERVSVDSGGVEGNGNSGWPSISSDGQIVAFASYSSNLISGDANAVGDVFVRDRAYGTTGRVSLSSNGKEGNAESYQPSISRDARLITFASYASNLVSGDTNVYLDTFVTGAFLTLEADPPSAPAGATLKFATWSGQASGANMLVVTGINGAAMFFPVIFGSFDAAGVALISATVPSGLAGNVISFETLGIIETGKVGVSNTVAVSFQ